MFFFFVTWALVAFFRVVKRFFFVPHWNTLYVVFIPIILRAGVGECTKNI